MNFEDEAGNAVDVEQLGQEAATLYIASERRTKPQLAAKLSTTCYIDEYIALAMIEAIDAYADLRAIADEEG